MNPHPTSSHRRRCTLALCLTLLTLAASPTLAQDSRGRVVESRFVQHYTTADIDSLSASLYAHVSYPRALYAVDQYMVTYLSTTSSERSVEITAQLFIPHTPRSVGVPLYIMGSGTTGIAQHCATSRELPSVRNWGNYRAHMTSYAAQGYLGILPDYQGFHDNPGTPHTYFVADLEARTMLDAARAIYNFAARTPFDVTLTSDIFLTGYSQGGHAAFAATDMAPSYAPELNIRGAIGYAPATDVEALMRDTPYLTPYILYAYAHAYGSDVVNLEQKINPRWLPTLARDVMDKCVDQIDKYYGWDAKQVYNPEFYNALYNRTLGSSFPELKAVLDKNSTGLTRNDVPALVIQGGGDPIVSTGAQNEFVRRHCTLDPKLTYRIYPGVHHFQARQYGFMDTLNWMNRVLNGESLTSDCPQILSQQ